MKLKKNRSRHLSHFIVTSFFIFILFTTLTYAQNKKTIKKRLHTVINQKKYTYIQFPEAEKMPGQKMIFLKKLNEFISKIFGSTYLSVIIYIAFLILFTYLLFFIIKKSAISHDKSLKKEKIDINTELYNLDYNKEFLHAEELIKNKKFKEAISFLLNALWLFYHYQKIIIFNKSITNREYLNILKKRTEYQLLKNIVFSAEQVVYARDYINEKDCKKILDNVNTIIS